jgi:transaldolase
VPATNAGVKAVQRLISQGVNVNVTLMFSIRHYEAVANAYIEGVNSFAASGGDVAEIASVASFFVSRVDTSVDLRLGAMNDARARALQGRIAIANSKLVYQRFKELFRGAVFDELHRRGARVQRLLWASTSTKNPAYPDTLYVDELIGPDTVNTMPPKTIGAFRDHGRPEPVLSKGLEEAQQILRDLDDLAIDLNQVTEQLQIDGIKAFADSYDQLLQTLSAKLATLQQIS